MDDAATEGMMLRQARVGFDDEMLESLGGRWHSGQSVALTVLTLMEIAVEASMSSSS